MQAPESLRTAHWVWNGIENTAWPTLSAETRETWSACATAARAGLLTQNALHAQLTAFIPTQTASA
jgi:hypothetical protein